MGSQSQLSLFLLLSLLTYFNSFGSSAVIERDLSLSLPTRLFDLTIRDATNNLSWSGSSVTTNAISTNDTVMPTQGWTASPNGRGTIDIIWSCGLTIFLCSWTVLCLNIPPRDFSQLKQMSQKLFITCEGILGPEFVFQTALGQWVSARRSVEAFNSSGHPEWTMSHAFLANMGGYVLHPPDFVQFPLDAKQLHYLVSHGYVEFSAVAISKHDIEDRNKCDTLARLITVFQILWFLVSTIARAMQGLAITTLELTVIGYIVCTLGTYYVWSHKPLDVKVPVVLVPNTTMANILIGAGACAEKPYKRTPMDFVPQEHSTWFLYWTHWFNILANMGLSFHTRKRPIDKIPDDQFLPLDTKTTPILFLVQTGYAAVHIAGWNFYFPTRTERLLWRISTVYIIIAIVIYWIADTYAFHVHPVFQKWWAASWFSKKVAELNMDQKCEPSKLRMKFHRIAAAIRNNSPDKDPDLEAPLKALIPVTTVAAIYCFARAYIVIEDFVILRALPASAYETVDWGAFFPHL